jgi:nucleotide-binding universal stress UspA family protein
MKIILKRVLVPTDFSNGSQAAVNYGIALAEEFGATLHVLHVLDGIVGIEPLTLPLPARKQAEREAEAIAWKELKDVLSKDDQARLKPVLALEWGTPFVEIIRYAKSHAIDLITLGNRASDRVTQLLLGDLVEQVVRGAPCPVLTIRRPQRHFVRP